MPLILLGFLRARGRGEVVNSLRSRRTSCSIASPTTSRGSPELPGSPRPVPPREGQGSVGGDKPAGGGGGSGPWVDGATAAMPSVSPNFLLWSRTRLQPQAPAAVEGGSGAAFTAGAEARLGGGQGCGPGSRARSCGFRVLAGFCPAGGSRPQGRPCRPDRALCPRARSVLLVSVLWPRSAKTPEPRKPDSAVRGSAGTSGQVTSGEHPPPPYTRRDVHTVGGKVGTEERKVGFVS